MQPHKILVTATMSAGKSSLINALAGQSVSRAANMACTDQISTLAINLGQEKIIVKDSPGVNSSMNASHRRITMKEVKKHDYDLLLYVMNATQLGTDDDSAYLEFIGEKATGKKIIFVLNKIDLIDPEEEKFSHVLKNAVRYLMHHGFVDPIMCPLSAKGGFMGKTIKEWPADDLARMEFLFMGRRLAELKLEDYYREKFGRDFLPPSFKGKELLRLSGLCHLEKLILSHYNECKNN